MDSRISELLGKFQRVLLLPSLSSHLRREDGNDDQSIQIVIEFSIAFRNRIDQYRAVLTIVPMFQIVVCNTVYTHKTTSWIFEATWLLLLTYCCLIRRT